MKIKLPVFCILFVFSCSGNKTETQQTKDTLYKDPAIVSIQPTQTIYNPADSGTMKGFIDLFQSSGTELPEWAVSFITEENVGRFTVKEVLETDPVYLLLYVQFVPVGPGVDKLYAVTLADDGTFISKMELGESYPSSGPGGGGKDYNYTYDTERKTINVSNTTTDWDDQKQEEFTYETWNPFYLKEGQVVRGRKYPEISDRYLEESDLASYSNDELKIMRNEIFAVYGYIFKTEPLKSHYSSMPWYKGERENVDDMLTEIEKTNVALIKKVENQI